MGSSAHPDPAEPAFVSGKARTVGAPIRPPAGRARITRPSPLQTAALASSIGPMTISPHLPNVALARAHAEKSLTVLDGTLSHIAADSAAAAEKLHEAGASTSPAPQMQAAAWWLHRVAASALATRATCRAARAAIASGGAATVERMTASGADDSRLEAAPSAVERTEGPERSVVVGYDGSEAATRALGRAAETAGDDALW
jgi:hypothetical protein